MKTKKRNIGNTQQPTTMVIKSGNTGWVAPVVGGVIIIGGFFAVKKFLSQNALNKAEGDTSPEGQIANQFKNVFGAKGSTNLWVNDVDYQAAALLLNNDNKKAVFEKYRALTDRNLSDDIANHISPSLQVKAAKIQQYNSKPGKLFSIDMNNNIKWEIVKGDRIRFQPGQTSPITAYNSPVGIILNDIKLPEVFKKLRNDPKTAALTVSIGLKPSALTYTALELKEIPYDGYKVADDAYKYIRPYVKVRKVFAAIRILAGYNKKKQPVFYWIDARDMVTFKKAIKGVGNLL